jgi:RimJ/RimL family protein N-acetyltransferase
MPRLIDPVVAAGSLCNIVQPELRAGDLLLRPWVEADADSLQAAFADPTIQRWHARTIESPQEAVERIVSFNEAWRTETAAHWAVTGPEFVGRIGLRFIDLVEGFAEIAYWVIPAARGRGVAVRAVAALSEWALDDLGLHRLDIQHSVANSASCRVAEKAGFTYEGTLRSSALHTDGWHDMHLHARVQGDV